GHGRAAHGRSAHCRSTGGGPAAGGRRRLPARRRGTTSAPRSLSGGPVGSGAGGRRRRVAHRGRRGVLGASALRFSRTRAGAGLTALIARAAPRAVPGTTAVRPELLIMRHPVPIGPVHLLAVS